MKKRRYTVGAAFADFYSIGIVAGGFEALSVAIMRRPFPLAASFLTLFATILVVILYHALISPRIRLRSPGEAMMGGTIVDGRKEWTNPYGRNRTVLFVLFFITLLIAANSWDGISDEAQYLSYSLPVVLVRMVVLSFVLWGLASFGSGRTGGGYYIAFYYIASAVGLWATKSSILGVLPVVYGMGVLMLAIGLVTVALVRFYGRGGHALDWRSANGGRGEG
jgi:hypothetical protein